MIHRQDQHCQFCLHYQGERKCLAFPDEIPDLLWTGKNLHHETYPGDHGFLYERKFSTYPDLTEEDIKMLG